MNEDTFNIEVRSFLEQVGVSSQREIERAVRRAIDSGRLTDVLDQRRCQPVSS